MSQNFLTVFNNLSAFKSYSVSQAKFLFQTIQISFGCLGFVVCLIYLVIYFITKKQASKQVIVLSSEQNDPGILQARVEQSPISAKPKIEPYVPQPAPGEIPWNEAAKP